VIRGHISLAIVGWLIKRLYKNKKVILVTHGIEVWQPLHGIKKLLIKNADLILTVSNFTRDKLIHVNGVNADRILLFHNTLDPYFALPTGFTQSLSLRNRYGMQEKDFILFTLTRLSSTEKYKGYDTVIRCIPQLISSIPALKYVIGGKWDEKEKQRIDELIRELKLESRVIFTGFIKESEINDHFQMSDLFIMPSQGEGFGIVFIEAMVCGLPVIAGNKDGSVDALQNGELGILIDPLSKEEIANAVLTHYKNKNQYNTQYKQELQKKALGYFEFAQYKKRLKKVLAA
jgi:phosphatidyl-myo-inositol dimannoside synthase